MDETLLFTSFLFFIVTKVKQSGSAYTALVYIIEQLMISLDTPGKAVIAELCKQQSYRHSHMLPAALRDVSGVALPVVESVELPAAAEL